MAEIVNLRTVRKQKARLEKQAVAAENRVLFGWTKSEKAEQAKEKVRAEKHVDGHKRDQ